jgi:hypothetical protein
MKYQARNLTGYKTGRLLAVSSTGEQNKKGEYFWHCQCDCGNTTIVRSGSLGNKGTKSCGCLIKEISKKIGRESRSWKGYEDIPGTYFRRIIEGALKRNIVFELQLEDIWQQYLKQNKKCSLTGIELYFDPSGYKDRYKGNVSVDRIDSDKGYTKDNIQLVHKDLNVMKAELTQNQFINYCRLVVKTYGQ